MVSLTGAQNAKPLVDVILQLQGLIAQLQSQATPGPIVIWKISIDAYVGPGTTPPSQNFLVNHSFTATHSGSIGNAVLSALQAELATAQTALAAIT